MKKNVASFLVFSALVLGTAASAEPTQLSDESLDLAGVLVQNADKLSELAQYGDTVSSLTRDEQGYGIDAFAVTVSRCVAFGGCAEKAVLTIVRDASRVPADGSITYQAQVTVLENRR